MPLSTERLVANVVEHVFDACKYRSLNIVHVCRCQGLVCVVQIENAALRLDGA